MLKAGDKIFHFFCFWNYTTQWRIQDFPQVGGTNSQKNYFPNYLLETAWKWKNLDPQGWITVEMSFPFPLYKWHLFVALPSVQGKFQCMEYVSRPDISKSGFWSGINRDKFRCRAQFVCKYLLLKIVCKWATILEKKGKMIFTNY